MHTENTGGYERMEKKIPLNPKTEKALNEPYKPEKQPKPKPQGEIGNILSESRSAGWLSPEDLKEEEEIIREFELEDDPKRSDIKKEKSGNA